MFTVDHTDHLVINTKNVDRCVKFYTEMLGFSLDSANNRLALTSGRQKINIHPANEKFYPVALNQTVGKIAFSIKSAIRKDRLDKYRIDPPQMLKSLQKTAPAADCFIADPDLNIIRIGQAPEKASIDCIYLPVADINASINFYETFAGMAADPANAARLVFPHGCIELLPKSGQEGPERISSGSGDFCLMARGDIREIYQFLASRNAPFNDREGIVPRHGAAGPIESVYLRDPDGNLVEISRPAR